MFPLLSGKPTVSLTECFRAALRRFGWQQPIVARRSGEVVAGKKMYLSVSIDHRIVDGATGAHWMNVIKDCLEHPRRLLFGRA